MSRAVENVYDTSKLRNDFTTSNPVKLATPLAREIYRRAQQEGWTDQELADKFGVSRDHLRKVFSDRAEFSLRMLSRSALMFGETIQDHLLAYLGSLSDQAPQQRRRSSGSDRS